MLDLQFDLGWVLRTQVPRGEITLLGRSDELIRHVFHVDVGASTALRCAVLHFLDLGEGLRRLL